MGPAAPVGPELSVRGLPPNIFAIVMATGIISLAVHGAGCRLLAHGLFWLNVGLYAVLWALLIVRVLRHRADLAVTGSVHSGEDALKVFAAGGRVAMMTSALLRHGPRYVRGVEEGVRAWLVEHEYQSVRQLEGSMSLRSAANPTAFVRGNYMKVLRSYPICSGHT